MDLNGRRSSIWWWNGGNPIPEEEGRTAGVEFGTRVEGQEETILNLDAMLEGLLLRNAALSDIRNEMLRTAVRDMLGIVIGHGRPRPGSWITIELFLAGSHWIAVGIEFDGEGAVVRGALRSPGHDLSSLGIISVRQYANRFGCTKDGRYILMQFCEELPEAA